MKTRITALFALLALLCTFAVACKPIATYPNESGSNESGSNETPVTPTAVRVYTMNGTTGFGMAKLMEDAANGTFESETYTFEVKSNFANDVLPALINGDADIAAIPTNGASVAYNKTQGKVKVLAVNTLGCLYIIGKEDVTTLSDLDGKTVFAPAQNPTYIFRYLCEQNGVNVTIDNQHSAPDALATAVASGNVDYAVLPEPMITVAKAKNADLKVSLDLTAEWNKLDGKKDTLVQGCVVVRTDFLEAHPEAIANFLKAYESSVNYVNSNVEEAADLIVKHGIFKQAPVAKKAIPKCNIHFVAGEDMKTAMNTYLTILSGIDATAIGGKVPDDAFYYPGK